MNLATAASASPENRIMATNVLARSLKTSTMALASICNQDPPFGGRGRGPQNRSAKVTRRNWHHAQKPPIRARISTGTKGDTPLPRLTALSKNSSEWNRSDS